MNDTRFVLSWAGSDMQPVVDVNLLENKLSQIGHYLSYLSYLSNLDHLSPLTNTPEALLVFLGHLFITIFQTFQTYLLGTFRCNTIHSLNFFTSPSMFIFSLVANRNNHLPELCVQFTKNSKHHRH